MNQFSISLTLAHEWYLNNVFISFDISAQLLDAASNVFSLVVAVTGRVGSDTPINCKSSGLRGVIVEETVCRFICSTTTNTWLIMFPSSSVNHLPICSLGRGALVEMQRCWFLDRGLRCGVLQASRSFLVLGEKCLSCSFPLLRSRICLFVVICQ